MRGKIYTLEEMDRVLPLVRAIVDDVRRGYQRLRAEFLRLGLGTSPDLSDGISERHLPWHVRDIVDEIRECIAELGQLGVFLRDPESGLVESYGEKEGEIVYFSWKPGEERVRYWHGLFRPARERRPVRTARPEDVTCA